MFSDYIYIQNPVNLQILNKNVSFCGYKIFQYIQKYYFWLPVWSHMFDPAKKYPKHIISFENSIVVGHFGLKAKIYF